LVLGEAGRKVDRDIRAKFGSPCVLTGISAAEAEDLVATGNALRLHRPEVIFAIEHTGGVDGPVRVIKGAAG
jgi:hypothetical protein